MLKKITWLLPKVIGVKAPPAARVSSQVAGAYAVIPPPETVGA